MAPIRTLPAQTPKATHPKKLRRARRSKVKRQAIEKPPDTFTSTVAKASGVTATAADTRTVFDVAKLAYESAQTIAGNRGFGDIEAQLQRIRALDRPGPRKTITIIGAGIASLAAAHELEKLGHTVKIIEGSDRIGGRIWTKRFADGSYHELGAMRIPQSHDYTRHYIDELGLSLRKFVTSHADPDAFYDIDGVQTPIKDAKQNLYRHFELSKEEAKEPDAGSILGHHLADLIASLSEEEKQSLFTTELSSDRLKKLDETSLEDFLKERTGSDAIDLIGLTTGLEPELDRPVTVYLRDELRKNGEGLEEIVGGMDQLPKGLAAKLHGPIELQTKVLGIKNRDDGKVELTLSKRGGKPIVELHENVLVTLPFSVLRGLQTSGFSRGKEQAIRTMSYGSATKVLLDTKRRFWESDYQIHGGASHSDQISGATYYPSDNAVKQDPLVSSGPGVLVGSYVWGQDARRLGAMTEAERERTVIDSVARFHPEIAEDGMVKDFATVSWDQNPWSAGAYGLPTVGQHDLYKEAMKPEGNIHFAGEHLSYDQGWIQGALISSLRAVEEIVTKP